MGSWIVARMHADRLRDRRRAFEEVFSVPGVPALHTEVHSLHDDFHVLLWAWAKPPVPDVVFVQNDEGGAGLLLCGVITGFGAYGAVPDTLKQVGAKVLNLWSRYGRVLLPELNGSFSLTFLEARQRAITLCTDRFASRSVWYTGKGTPCLAGNFPAAIAALLPEKPYLDPAGLWSLFFSSRPVGRHGLFHGIESLLAGEYVTLHEAEGGSVAKWFNHRYKPEPGCSPKEWGERIATQLRIAGQRLDEVTSQPYLFLSGGLDSRVAAGVLRGRSHTVTLTTGMNMNARLAERVARRVGAVHTTIERDPYWYLDTYEAAALASGGNYNITHAHYMIPVQEIRAEDSGAAFLLGDMLENFNKHYFKRLPDDNNLFIPEQIPSLFHHLYSYVHPNQASLKRLFQPEVAERIAESWRQALVQCCEAVREVSHDARDCLDTLFRWNNCSACPTYLMFDCITPMSSTRNLMCDNDMLDLHLRIPAGVRGAKVTHPWTLWHLDKGLALIPDSNFWLPPIMPNALNPWTRKVRALLGKMRRGIIGLYSEGPIAKTEGSWHMLHEWYRKDRKHIAFIEACLFNEHSLPSEIFNHTEIRKCWNDFLAADNAFTFEIDMLLTFALLHRRIPSAGLKL